MTNRLTDEDIERIRAALSPPHQCHFDAESIAALRDFATQLKDPKTRSAIITVSEVWIDGTSTVRRWAIRMFMIGVAAMVLLGLYKAGGVPK